MQQRALSQVGCQNEVLALLTIPWHVSRGPCCRVTPSVLAKIQLEDCLLRVCCFLPRTRGLLEAGILL